MSIYSITLLLRLIFIFSRSLNLCVFELMKPYIFVQFELSCHCKDRNENKTKLNWVHHFFRVWNLWKKLNWNPKPKQLCSSHLSSLMQFYNSYCKQSKYVNYSWLMYFSISSIVLTFQNSACHNCMGLLKSHNRKLLKMSADLIAENLKVREHAFWSNIFLWWGWLWEKTNCMVTLLLPVDCRLRGCLKFFYSHCLILACIFI